MGSHKCNGADLQTVHILVPAQFPCSFSLLHPQVMRVCSKVACSWRAAVARAEMPSIDVVNSTSTAKVTSPLLKATKKTLSGKKSIYERGYLFEAFALLAGERAYVCSQTPALAGLAISLTLSRYRGVSIVSRSS